MFQRVERPNGGEPSMEASEAKCGDLGVQTMG